MYEGRHERRTRGLLGGRAERTSDLTGSVATYHRDRAAATRKAEAKEGGSDQQLEKARLRVTVQSGRSKESEKTLSKRLVLTLVLAAAMSVGIASAAFAQAGAQAGGAQAGGPNIFHAQLSPLNGSGASGSATLLRNGNRLATNIHSSGIAPNLPHAQHIHGFAQAVSECPTLAASGRDNLITTAEGQPSYGPIQVSLTTTGDTSLASALAVDRFPVATGAGTLNYSRTLTVPAGVAQDLGKKAIVQHGVDLNGNGEYDFAAAGKSELDPSLPQEATIPANCGVINP
jgi:hypothetical protein